MSCFSACIPCTRGNHTRRSHLVSNPTLHSMYTRSAGGNNTLLSSKCRITSPTACAGRFISRESQVTASSILSASPRGNGR